MRVTKKVLWEVTRSMTSRDVASGPDGIPGSGGIPGRIWGEAMGVVAPKFRRLYTKCLRKGVYLQA
jgi:hypothetical protein